MASKRFFASVSECARFIATFQAVQFLILPYERQWSVEPGGQVMMCEMPRVSYYADQSCRPSADDIDCSETLKALTAKIFNDILRAVTILTRPIGVPRSAVRPN